MYAHRIKLVEYRRLSLRPRFLFLTPGPLVTKKSARAKDTKRSLRQKLRKQVKRLRWNFAPRAKLAVSFRFYDRATSHLDVYNLVKFYLDTLQGIVFEDDRQVHYLEAAASRVPAGGGESSAFIQVHRLRDYERYVELASEVEPSEDEESDISFHPNYLDDPYAAVADRQRKALSRTQVLSHSSSARRLGFASMMDLFTGTHPFIFHLGGIPKGKDESAFKSRIRQTLSDYMIRVPLLRNVHVPIELNAQITRQGLKQGKDLDNVLRLVCPIIKEKLLDHKAYINGYRAYVLGDEVSPPRLSIQLLPIGAIATYNKSLEAGFKAYGADLGELLR